MSNELQPTEVPFSWVEYVRRDQDAEDELHNAHAALKRAAELTTCKWQRANLLKAAAHLETL